MSRAATVKYDVRLTTGKEPNASNANLNDYYVQTVSFEIKFNAAGKPVKDLKITSLKSTDYDVHLVDGVWFVDTTDSKFNLATFSSNEFTVGVAKNDGSSFTNKAVYTIIGYTQDTKSGDRNYLSYGVDGSDAVDAKELDYDKQTTQKGTIPLIIPGTTIGNITDTNPAKTWNQAYLNSQSDLKIPHEIWIQVETEDAIYRAKAYFVLRTSIVARNPEGVYFKDRTITLAVNQVLFPAYVTNVDPLKDISSDVELFYTDNADRNIYSIVKKDGKYSLIGMKEGTSYVSLSYSWKGASSPTAPILYGDTAKIVVSGITPIEPGTKYVVTASRLNVRKSAGTGSAIVTTYAKGTVVEVVEIKDGWAKLSTGNYVSAQYLIKYSSSTVIGTKSVTARTLNVRAGAGTSYAIVGKLTRGSKVDVVEIVAGGAWAKINYAGSTYYVSTSYLA
ncbi:MAG: SH3 domain-containing protein [Christensenellaceae bacterium]|nr:SH3 domain-containing protein [Christensenellaceae bacterium]